MVQANTMTTAEKNKRKRPSDREVKARVKEAKVMMKVMPGTSLREIAKAVNLAPMTLSKYVKKKRVTGTRKARGPYKKTAPKTTTNTTDTDVFENYAIAKSAYKQAKEALLEYLKNEGLGV